MRKFELPEWTVGLPDATLLDTKDIASIFKYKNRNSVCQLVEDKLLPPPDHRFETGGRFKTNRLLWELGTLRELANQQRENS